MEPFALTAWIVAAAAIGYGNYRYVRGSRDVKGLADAEFRQIRVETGPPALCFDGREAEVVAERVAYEDRHRIRVASVTRYGRNAHGEYFFSCPKAGESRISSTSNRRSPGWRWASATSRRQAASIPAGAMAGKTAFARTIATQDVLAQGAS